MERKIVRRFFVGLWLAQPSVGTRNDETSATEPLPRRGRVMSELPDSWAAWYGGKGGLRFRSPELRV